MKPILQQLNPLQRLRSTASSQPYSRSKPADGQQLQHQLEDELARLVAMPTYSSSAQTAGSIIALGNRHGTLNSVAAIEYVTTELRQAGLHVKTFESGGYHSVVGTSRHTKRPKVMLLGHIDVIPVKDQSQLQLRKSNDKLYGRGVFDMKFAIAGYIHFIRTHRHQLKELDFGIMINSDEEVGGFHGAKLLAEQGWGGDIIVNPDGGDNWQVESMAKGIWMVDLVATGKSAHGSRPWEGKSAIDTLLPALSQIIALFDNQERMGTTCNVGRLQAGDSFNQVAAQGRAVLDIRSYDSNDAEAKLKQAAAIAKTCGVQLSIKRMGPPVHIDTGHPAVVSFAKHTAAVSGQPSGFTPSFGGTDARWFSAADMQPIVIRPIGGGSHSDHEWLQADDLGRFYQLIEQAVLDLARP